MIRGEIEIARDNASKSIGKPKIIPVRVAYLGLLPYPINAYLDQIQYATWHDPEDTRDLLREILNVIAGGRLTGAPSISQERKNHETLPPASAAQMSSPGGTLG